MVISIEVKYNRMRKFGIEYEFTNRSGAGTASNSQTLMKQCVESVAGQRCRVSGYDHNVGNNEWVAKTDGSCGWECVTPVMSGPRDLKAACDVLQAIQARGFNVTTSCGQHVHVSTSDYSEAQIKIMVMWWLKIEKFIMNVTPGHRRGNTYCRQYNDLHTFQPNRAYTPDEVWSTVRANMDRYRALNLNHFRAGNENSRVEFRFGDMTFDVDVVKNRVRFLVWFLDLCKNLPAPSDLNWFTPKQALRFFGLLEAPGGTVVKTFSDGVRSMRQWLLDAFERNAPRGEFTKDRETVAALKAAVAAAPAPIADEPAAPAPAVTAAPAGRRFEDRGDDFCPYRED